MYTLKIDISDWGAENETVTIETNDFSKAQAIQEFIEMQQENDWAADYVHVDEDGEPVVEFEEDEEVDDIEEEDEPSTISTYVITKIEE